MLAHLQVQPPIPKKVMAPMWCSWLWAFELPWAPQGFPHSALPQPESPAFFSGPAPEKESLLPSMTGPCLSPPSPRGPGALTAQSTVASPSSCTGPRVLWSQGSALPHPRPEILFSHWGPAPSHQGSPRPWTSTCLLAALAEKRMNRGWCGAQPGWQLFLVWGVKWGGRRGF